MKTKRVVVSIMTAVMLCGIPISTRADGNTGGIHGYVREHSWKPNVQDKPVAGATVYLWDGYEQSDVKTDMNGFYVVFGLPPGIYEISADNGAHTTSPFLSERVVCVHAGNVEDVNLLVVPRLVADYDYAAAIRERYRERFQPDASQTADMYSLGNC